MEQKQSQSEGSAPERPIPIIDPDQCHCDSCDFNRKSSSLYFRNVKEAANGAGPSAKKCLNDGSRNENNFPLFVLKEVDDSSDEDDSKSALLRSDKLKMNPMTMLNENVARAFNDFQLIKPTALQSAVWKKLFRGMNVTIVSEAGTGKTLCYLPVLLSKLKDEIDECRSERRSTKLMQKQICPFAVIVCPNVVQLFSLLVTIYKFELRDVNFNYLLSPISKHLAAVHDRSSVYLLLCTPRALAEAIESQFVDFRFLKMLVFESMSLLNDQQIFDCNSLVLDLKSKLDFHGVEEPLQFVFVSDVWLPVIQRWQERWQMNIDHNLASQIEACLFRGHRFDLQFCRNDNEKETVLIERLRRLSVRDKVFIVTNDDGVFPNIAHILEQNAIQFSKIEDDFEMKQIDDLHAEWEAQPNSPKVVLVSDFSVHLFPVSDITLIINYELPKFYDRFQSRFSVLCCDMNDYSKKRPICDILILFDETKPKIEAFRLLNLLKRMDGYKGQALQQYDQIIQDFETEKDVKKGQLCFSFMVTGQCAVTCANYICRRSHHFIADPNDFLSNQYPSKGCVQFEIVEVLSPSQFAVRVSKAFDENGDEVSIQTVYDNGYLVAHELSKIQSKLNKKDKSLKVTEYEKKCVGFKDLRVGNDYVYAYKGCFVRVKLINIHENMSVDLLVTDRGIELYNKKCEQMYELKGVLRSAQAQVVTVVLANLVPYNKEDSNYCLHCERIFSDVVKTYTTRKSQYFFQGNILLKYGSIFWLDDVQIYSQTSEKTLPITIFSFRNYLIREKMSRYDSSNLKRISEKVKVAINNVSITQTCVDPEKPKHVQWAFLPDNPFTGTQVDIITFEETCTFYVRISVFTKLLLTLEDEINADSLLLRAVHFKDNNYYLAKSAIDKRYHRAYVAAGALAHDGVVSCRFVDSGRKEDVNLDELRSLDQYYVSRLPFQAIRCRLFGLHVVAPVTCDISDSIVARNPMMAYCNSLESETETTALFSGLSYAVVLSSDTETLNVVLPTQFPTCFQTNTNESFIEIHQAPDNQNISTIAECNDDDEDDDDNEIRPSTGILDRNWSENEDNNGDGNSVAYPDDPTFFSCDFDDGDWDVNICDINEFAEHAKKAFNENKMQEKTDELKKPSSSRSPLKELTLYPKIKDDDSLFPTIKWGQSDKLIELNIKILYAFDTKVKIDKNRTDFRFESKSKNETKPYRFNFCLFSSVSRAFKIIESSFEVVVKLKKHTFAEHWDSLTQNDHIYKNWLSRACLSHSRPKDGDCSESDAEDDMGVGVGVGAFTGPSKSKIPTMSEDLKNALKSCGPDKDELIVEQNSDYDSCSDYSDTDAED